jgi:RHS repeat-associated protein
MSMTARYTVIDGEVVSEKRDGMRSLYVPDSLGSTLSLLDTSQAQTDSFVYWPYGVSIHVFGSSLTPFQFVGTLGYYNNSPTRAYVRARVLDAPTGRWITEDPLGLNGDSYNFFQYVRGCPVSAVDPTGLFPSCLAFRKVLGPTKPGHEPLPPTWPPPPRLTIRANDCSKLGPGTGGLPPWKQTEECTKCCDKVLGHSPGNLLARCYDCCGKYNVGGPNRRHCAGRWITLPLLPGMTPSIGVCPPGTMYDLQLKMCAKICNWPFQPDGSGGCEFIDYTPMLPPIFRPKVPPKLPSLPRQQFSPYSFGG